ncbi:MAG: hypothetical protein CMM07_29265, partial [Rhodopirellula sp.]|nr:hypothetical protein [Rhodopirellula sp.]
MFLPEEGDSKDMPAGSRKGDTKGDHADQGKGKQAGKSKGDIQGQHVNESTSDDEPGLDCYGRVRCHRAPETDAYGRPVIFFDPCDGTRHSLIPEIGEDGRVHREVCQHNVVAQSCALCFAQLLGSDDTNGKNAGKGNSQNSKGRLSHGSHEGNIFVCPRTGVRKTQFPELGEDGRLHSIVCKHFLVGYNCLVCLNDTSDSSSDESMAPIISTLDEGLQSVKGKGKE